MPTLDLDRLEQAVAAAEKRTRAEIVLVINRRSGDYLDREVLAAALAGLLALQGMVLAPVRFAEIWLVPNALFVAALAFWAARRVPALGRALLSPARRDAQTLLYARNAFVRLAVGATRERTGLLVYVSLLEDRVLLLPDFALEGRLPPARFAALVATVNPLSARPDPTAALARLLEEAGALLAADFPPAPDNPDELPNRPRLEVL